MHCLRHQVTLVPHQVPFLYTYIFCSLYYQSLFNWILVLNYLYLGFANYCSIWIKSFHDLTLTAGFRQCAKYPFSCLSFGEFLFRLEYTVAIVFS